LIWNGTHFAPALRTASQPTSPLSHGAMAAALLTLALGSTLASAQVIKAPRYTGGLDAPTQQLNLPPLPAAISPNGKVVENVVARVNDQIISRSDVERSEQQLQQEGSQASASSADVSTRQQNMLRDMIDQQLLLSRAKQMGLNVDADVIRQLDEIRKQNKMATMEDLAAAARQQGVSFEDFKAKVRDQLLTQQVVREEVGRRLQMTHADEQKYYDAHPKDFDQPEQVRLSEILIPVPENGSTEALAVAKAKADEVDAKIKQGDNFADLAKKFSGGPSAAQGGELGLFKHGALAKVLEDETFGLPVGQVTAPIRTRQGFVILKVTEHQQSGPAPLSAVEPKVQEAMYMQEMQPALRTYLTKLREAAYIDIAPGFVDSGASPNETKPVFSAYAPPAVKKKKVEQKGRFDRGSGRFSTATRVVASPDTTGTRTLTGKDASPLIDSATGLAKLPESRSRAGNSKQKHLRREKVRFGQAPRDALPAAADDTLAADGTPAAAGAATATDTAGAASATSSTLQPQETQSADLSDNPLAPKPAVQKKGRFSATESAVKAGKAKSLTRKQIDKIQATPAPAPEDETAARKVQSAPLGLAGDTSKKKKKRVKHVKGTRKGRLQDQAPAAKPQPAPIAPTANPDLAPTSDAPPALPSTETPPPNML
jgi:peptidyl-prolyl cis-trans isomerase SurA